MSLIQEYIELTKTCASTDYEDKMSVMLHNKSVDRMYQIAEKICSAQTTETVDDFTKLLDIPDYKTNMWAATHLLERMTADSKAEIKGLSIIQNIASGESVESRGYKIWLKNYHKK